MGVSANGTKVVGWGLGNSHAHGVLWTNQTPAILQGPPAPCALGYQATGISANGNYIVGTCKDNSGGEYGIRWTNGIPDIIGNLGPDGFITRITNDGQIIVGWYDEGNGTGRALRWISGRGIELLPSQSMAWDISDAGMIVGTLLDQGQPNAFRWIGNDVRSLDDLLDCSSQGTVLLAASAVSPDGCVIAGVGINPNTNREDAFLFYGCTPHNGDVDCNGCVDDADLLEILFNYGSSAPCPGILGKIDANCDGIVDDADLLIVLFGFGSGC